MNEIQEFLQSGSFAVAGASRERSKYGYKVFRALVQSGRQVYPVNPSADEIDGVTAYPTLVDLPEVPSALSIVTPPAVTVQVVQQAIAEGVKHIWMQPGAQHPTASADARQAGINVIDDGSCILVALATERRRDRADS